MAYLTVSRVRSKQDRWQYQIWQQFRLQKGDTVSLALGTKTVSTLAEGEVAADWRLAVAGEYPVSPTLFSLAT